MNKETIVKTILSDRSFEPSKIGFGFAPVNFALIKYWGKRNTELNLPITPSLSIALPEKGAFITIQILDRAQDEFFLNHQPLSKNHPFVKSASHFLDLFRTNQQYHFRVETQLNIPAASGLASSACIFAAFIRALNDLFSWQLSQENLSILARLGSGSACRSLWNGFVEWEVGQREDGMDSYGKPLPEIWDSLCIGLLILESKKKNISSREAMQKTVETSGYYASWPEKVAQDLPVLKQAIKTHDFETFGKTCESNALAMHASMLTAWPPIVYWTPKSLKAIQKIWKLRQEGLPIYFTQDAGANLKLLFLHQNLQAVRNAFEEIEITWPFTPSGIKNHVVLVDQHDRAIGTSEKMMAHQNAFCHRAFSIFIFRKNKQELLIQQRHPHKYHCGGLWTNTCCSHPKPGENIIAAGERRLQEEIGISTPLIYKGFFHYIAPFKNQLTENEVDHVLVGDADSESFNFNREEIADLRWIEVGMLQKSLINEANLYTPWFSQALQLALTHV